MAEETMRVIQITKMQVGVICRCMKIEKGLIDLAEKKSTG